MIRRHHPVLLAALVLSACAVGPKYTPPAASIDEHWIAPADTAAIDLTWWHAFGDPVLDELIASAVAHNLDLKAADANLRAARASRDAAAGRRYPELDVNASATRNGWSEHGPIPVSKIPGFQRDYNLFQASFDASWEIDLWGHNARAVEAAEARAEGAAELRRDTLMRVIAEVARSYVDLRSAQAQLESGRADAEARTQVAELVSQRYAKGEASRFDFVRADAQARSARALLPGFDADTHAAAYRLAFLTGAPPEALAAKLLAAAPLPEGPGAVTAGLRSDLLRRRPDVRQAERQLAAATADAGVATAELFPRISLVGSIGQQAQNTSDFAASSSTYYSIGPSLHWPIFAGGTLRANVRAANARADAAGAAYESAVLTALSDSETAVNRLAAARAASEERENVRRQNESALALARQRYRAGEDDLIVLLDSQSDYSAAEQLSIVARTAVLDAAIALYKSLGGGWESFEPTAAR